MLTTAVVISLISCCMFLSIAFAQLPSNQCGIANAVDFGTANETFDPFEHMNERTYSVRIITPDDNSTRYYEFPWVVAVLAEYEILSVKKNSYHCVGSLINPLVVLTAAHSISGIESDKLIIQAGEYDLEISSTTRQERGVSRIVIHENYERRGFFNDIALLFLKDRFEINMNVNIICLPPPSQIYDSQNCFVSGWGKDRFDDNGKYQTTLKMIELPLVPRDQCITELRKTKLGVNYELPNDFVCAGGETGIDSCTGDGGGPLMCPIPGTVNKFVQVGIVSWGIGCGTSTPGIYVNVPLYRNWIDGKLQR